MKSLSPLIIKGSDSLLISYQMDPTTLSAMVASCLLKKYQLDLWLVASVTPTVALGSGSR